MTIVAIEDGTERQLRRLVGTRLTRVAGVRYPNPLSYSQVRLSVDDGTTVVVDVRMEDVTERFEVGCISVAADPSSEPPGQQDEIRLTDFRVDRIFVLRRAEWLEDADVLVPTVGDHPVAQRFGHPREVPASVTHALVDAGVELVDDRGGAIRLQADSFPMVLQWEYIVGSSQIPRGEARAISP